MVSPSLWLNTVYDIRSEEKIHRMVKGQNNGVLIYTP